MCPVCIEAVLHTTAANDLHALMAQLFPCRQGTRLLDKL